jgi:predicted nucleotidyltransferase
MPPMAHERGAKLVARSSHGEHAIMRPTDEQADAIRRIVGEEAGADSVVRIFGSRLDDTARGGDVDLMVETIHPLNRPALTAARLSARLLRALHGRRVDVLLAAPNLAVLPIHAIAMQEGVRL